MQNSEWAYRVMVMMVLVVIRKLYTGPGWASTNTYLVASCATIYYVCTLWAQQRVFSTLAVYEIVLWAASDAIASDSPCCTRVSADALRMSLRQTEHRSSPIRDSCFYHANAFQAFECSFSFFLSLSLSLSLSLTERERERKKKYIFYTRTENRISSSIAEDLIISRPWYTCAELDACQNLSFSSKKKTIHWVYCQRECVFGSHSPTSVYQIISGECNDDIVAPCTHSCRTRLALLSIYAPRGITLVFSFSNIHIHFKITGK